MIDVSGIPAGGCKQSGLALCSISINSLFWGEGGEKGEYKL